MKEVQRKAISDGDQTGKVATVLESTVNPGVFGIVALNADGTSINNGSTTTITGNYIALATDRVIRCNHTAPITITLPVVSVFPAKKYIIEDVSGNGAVNHITIVPQTGDTVNGSESNYSIMGDFRSVEVCSNGVSNWDIIRGFSDMFFNNNARFCSVFATNSSRDEVGLSSLGTTGSLVTSFISGRAFNTITPAAGIGVFGGVFNGGAFSLNFIREQEPNFSFIIRTGASLTDQRIWIGFTNSIPGNSDTLPSQGMAVRYSSVAGDVNWKYVTRNGVTQTTTDSGIVVTASTTYKIRLRFDNTNISALFSINNSGETAISTTLPAASLGMGFSARINNTTATQKPRLISFIKGRYT